MTRCLLTCFRCEQRQKRCAGPCACTIDGKDIREHAAAADCPIGRHASDYRQRPPEKIPDDYDPERDKYKGRCCS